MGFVFFAAVMRWVGVLGLLPLALLAAILGLAPVASALFTGWLGTSYRARILSSVVSWAAVEWIRGIGPYGVPWAQLGHTQADFLPFVRLTRYVGLEGLAALIVFFNASLAEALLSRRNWRPLCWAAAAAALAALPGMFAGERAAAVSVRAAVVQPSVMAGQSLEQLLTPPTPEQELKELDAYEQLTRSSLAHKPLLIVWPESAVPGFADEHPEYVRRVARLAKDGRAWLLAGAHAFLADGEYNSALLFSPEGRLSARYDKVHLVPFGEYVPGRRWLPLLDRYPVRETDIYAGKGFKVLSAGKPRIGPIICFESAFPSIARLLSRRGANLLAIMTNDSFMTATPPATLFDRLWGTGWQNAGAEQHMRQALFRAAENRLPVVRAAATGISCIISPTGEVLARAGPNERKVLIADLPLGRGPGRFGRLAPLAGPGSLLACLLMSLARLGTLAKAGCGRGRKKAA
jgi:apolipoprotein N-acyltransferase